MKKHLPWCIVYFCLFWVHLYYAFNGVVEWLRPINAISAGFMIVCLRIELRQQLEWMDER